MNLFLIFPSGWCLSLEGVRSISEHPSTKHIVIKFADGKEEKVTASLDIQCLSNFLSKMNGYCNRGDVVRLADYAP